MRLIDSLGGAQGIPLGTRKQRDFSFVAQHVADRELVNDWKKARSTHNKSDRYTFRDVVETWANPAVYGDALLGGFYSCVLISSRRA